MEQSLFHSYGAPMVSLADNIKEEKEEDEENKCNILIIKYNITNVYN